MRTKLLGPLVAALLMSALFSAVSMQSLETRAQADVMPWKNVSSSGIAIITGGDLSNDDSLIQVRRMLEHEGLLYKIIPDNNLSSLGVGNYDAIIVLGSSQPYIDLPQNSVASAVEAGTGLIWIGGELPDSVLSLLGLTADPNILEVQNARAVRYGDLSTEVFNETLYQVALAGASARGFFVDGSNRILAPAEVSFKRQGSGLTYYFSYDAASWWFSDLNTPWLRAYRLNLALENVLSEHLVLRLASYPRNLRSAFITRVEDVDPIHNSYEWISRANGYLNYYSSRSASVTVSLIPTYMDPSVGLTARIEDDSASPLRTWLSSVLLRGGTIVQQGYTHQYGDQKTGVAPEFFNPDAQIWLPFAEQKNRISKGAEEIHASLGFIPKGFEAPHYLADSDTYAALNALGFDYVTQNSNTPFFDRFGMSGELVNIPETLGYIPVDAPSNLEGQMKLNMDMLYNMGAVMLFFDHLFDENALRIGENLLNYALTKDGVWLTNTASLANFWIQRMQAYDKMSFTGDSRIEVTLGPSNQAGLTLVFNHDVKIQNLIVNGAEWPIFKDNYALLPVLTESNNKVIIDLSSGGQNQNMTLGLFSILLSVAVSCMLIQRVVKNNRSNRKSERREKP